MYVIRDTVLHDFLDALINYLQMVQVMAEKRRDLKVFENFNSHFLRLRQMLRRKVKVPSSLMEPTRLSLHSHIRYQKI